MQRAQVATPEIIAREMLEDGAVIVLSVTQRHHMHSA